MTVTVQPHQPISTEALANVGKGVVLGTSQPGTQPNVTVTPDPAAVPATPTTPVAPQVTVTVEQPKG